MKRTQNQKKLVYLFIIIIIIIPVLININIDTVDAQPIQTSKCMITIEPMSDITSNLSPIEIIDKLQTQFLLSTSLTNNMTTPINITIPRGTIFFNPPDEIRSVSMYDSTGKSINQIFEGNYILNPELTQTLEPSSTYNLTLIVKTDPIVTYDEKENIFFIESDLTPSFASHISLNIPKEFTILECTSNYYHETNEAYTSLKWIIPKDQLFHLFTKFLPFSKAPISKSFIFTFYTPEVFPTGTTLITSSFKHVFESPKVFSHWVIDPIPSHEMSFPIAQKVTVEKVFDSLGECAKSSRPLEGIDEDNLGYYFVDNENHKVIVYPRYHEFASFYEYSIEAIFNSQNEEKNVRNLLPYQNQYNFSITGITTMGNWKQDLTGNLEIIFSLPSGIDPIWANEEFLEGMKDDKRIVKFIYNSPKTLPTKSWLLTVAIESLRTLFLIQIITIIILSLFLFLCFFLNNHSLRVLIPQIGIPTGLVLLDLAYIRDYWYDFITIGGTKLVFLFLFGIKLMLLATIFFITFTKFKETLKITIEKIWDLGYQSEEFPGGTITAWVIMNNPSKSKNIENIGTRATTIKSISVVKKSKNTRTPRIADLSWNRDYYLSKLSSSGDLKNFPISDTIESGHRIIFSLPYINLLNVLLDNNMLNLERKFQGRFALVIDHVLGKDKSNSFKLYLSEELRKFILRRKEAFGHIIVPAHEREKFDDQFGY